MTPRTDRTCSVDGCTRKHYGRGYCGMHWARWSRTGSVHIERDGVQYDALTPAARLEARSERIGECLIYTAGTPSKAGHVRITIGKRDVQVHRVAYELAHGPIPDGLVVRHKCDTPRCIEPSHLQLGTQLDNIADRDRRGRHRALRGSANPIARLSEWQVEEILRLLAAGNSAGSLARKYGVSKPTIQRIKDGRGWVHVARPEGLRSATKEPTKKESL